MHYTAVFTKAGRRTLAKFPVCPGSQTFADRGEDIGERASEALLGWLEAHLVSGQAPPEPKTVRPKGRARTFPVPVPAKLAVKLAAVMFRRQGGHALARDADAAATLASGSSPLYDPKRSPGHQAARRSRVGWCVRSRPRAVTDTSPSAMAVQSEPGMSGPFSSGPPIQ